MWVGGIAGTPHDMNLLIIPPDDCLAAIAGLVYSQGAELPLPGRGSTQQSTKKQHATDRIPGVIE